MVNKIFRALATGVLVVGSAISIALFFAYIVDEDVAKNGTYQELRRE